MSLVPHTCRRPAWGSVQRVDVLRDRRRRCRDGLPAPLPPDELLDMLKPWTRPLALLQPFFTEYRLARLHGVVKLSPREVGRTIAAHKEVLDHLGDSVAFLWVSGMKMPTLRRGGTTIASGTLSRFFGCRAA